MLEREKGKERERKREIKQDRERERVCLVQKGLVNFARWFSLLFFWLTISMNICKFLRQIRFDLRFGIKGLRPVLAKTKAEGYLGISGLYSYYEMFKDVD